MNLLNALVCGTAIVLLSLGAVMCWRRRHQTAGAVWQLGVMLAGIWWSTGILISSLAGPSLWHLEASALKTIGAPVMAICYQIVVHTLVRPGVPVRRLPVTLMFVPVVAYVVLFALPATRGLTLGRLRVEPDEVSWEPGLMFWLLMGYSVLLTVWAGASQASAISLTSLRHRPQLRSHLLGATLVMLGAAASMVLIVDNGGAWPSSRVEGVVTGLIGTALLDLRAMRSQHFLQGTPIGRASVLHGLEDAVLVFDAEGHLGDYNEAAAQLFGGRLRPGLSEARVREWLGEPIPLGEADYRHWRGRELQLTQRQTSPHGHTLTLSDVTDANRYARKLLADNEQLRRHVSSIEERQTELARQAERDALTGLANRRVFQTRLTELTEAGRPFAVALIDVDHFKRVNDTQGHLVGDQVLAGAARGLVGFVRDGETLCRYGGEEFLLLIPDGSRTDARLRAEAARRWFESTPITTTDGTVALTISAGVAGSGPSDPSDTVLADADKALYLAKSRGRNRVEVAGLR